MLGKLLRTLFGRSRPGKSGIPSVRPEKPVAPQEIERGISILKREAHSVKRFSGPFWKKIRPLEVGPGIMGAAYLRGRSEGLKVNRALVLTEFDDDMEFTALCVAIDGHPALEVDIRWQGVTLCALERDIPLLVHVTGSNRWKLDTLGDFEALPHPWGRSWATCCGAFARCRLGGTTSPRRRIGCSRTDFGQRTRRFMTPRRPASDLQSGFSSSMTR
jgi:hypothetical protein